MKKLLWVSDNPLTAVSYGQITHEICSRIGSEIETHVLAFYYFGRSIRSKNYFIHSYENAKSLANILNNLKPDYLIWLGDPVIMKDILRVNLGDTKFIPYYPCDGSHLVYGAKEILQKAHKLITMTNFSQKVSKKAGFDPTVVYHGVDNNVFKPLPAEKSLFNIPEDKFVFFSFGVNTGRKMLFRTIRCFNEFAKDKDNVVLLMRTDPEKQFNLIEFTNYRFPELFKKKKIYFSISDLLNPAPSEFIAKLYNASDVFISATGGEGFGVPYIEAMACKKPVIAPDFSSTHELLVEQRDGIGPRGIATKISEYAADMTVFIDRGICSVEDTVKAMNLLYQNKEKRNEFGENGLKFVKKFCNWDDISKKVLEILS